MGITLAKGEKYRISALVRTKDFNAGDFRIGVTAVKNGRLITAGIDNVDPTMPWRKVEVDVEMFEAPKKYAFAIHIGEFTGEVEISGVALEPLTEKGKKLSSPSAVSESAHVPRLIPWKPKLACIPCGTREMVFRFRGKPPKGLSIDDCMVAVQVDGVDEVVTLPLKKMVKIVLPAGAPPKGKMKVKVSAKDAPLIAVDEYQYALKSVKEHSTAGHKELNNFVTEVLCEVVDSDSATYRFTTARDGWTFFRVEGAAEPTLALDGVRIIEPAWNRKEAFREIGAGEHALEISSAKGARVVVRSIVETVNYPACVNSLIKEIQPYDWKFFAAYVMPNVTVHNGGKIPDGHLDELRAFGGKWFSNFTIRRCPKTAEGVAEGLIGTDRLSKPCFDGTTVDEIFLTRAEQLEYFGGGLKKFNAAYMADKKVYTWVVGALGGDGLSQELMASVVNSCNGKGKALFEMYHRTLPDEVSAADHIKRRLCGMMRTAAKVYPETKGSIGLILGNYNQMPLISLVFHPEVDFKYFLDMQLHLMANDSAFKDLACTGFWGSYYADHETYRWSMELLRHYCIEGCTEMLSKKYGFSYIPGHLKNGDFRNAFDGWETTGDVGIDEIQGLGAKSEGRWLAKDGSGDMFAVLTKTDGAVSRLQQQICGLVPGRTYCLKAVVFDVDDMKRSKHAPRRYKLNVAVEGAKKDPSLSWVHVDRRKAGKNNDMARINLHQVVFIAESAQATVIIENVAAKKGKKLGVNAVSVMPYFTEAMHQKR